LFSLSKKEKNKRTQNSEQGNNLFKGKTMRKVSCYLCGYTLDRLGSTKLTIRSKTHRVHCHCAQKYSLAKQSAVLLQEKPAEEKHIKKTLLDFI
jgi:hypothetical protein